MTTKYKYYQKLLDKGMKPARDAEFRHRATVGQPRAPPDKPIRLVGLVKDVRNPHDPHGPRRVAETIENVPVKEIAAKTGQRGHRDRPDRELPGLKRPSPTWKKQPGTSTGW